MLLDLPAIGSRVRVKFISGRACENAALKRRIGQTAEVLNNTSGSGHPLYCLFDDGFKAVFKVYEVEQV